MRLPGTGLDLPGGRGADCGGDGVHKYERAEVIFSICIFVGMIWHGLHRFRIILWVSSLDHGLEGVVNHV